MNTEMASDEVTDSIAHIEMVRQEAAKESGLAAACSEALRKLHELLRSERESAQNAPNAGNSLNIEAVTREIDRVKKLAGGGSQPGRARETRPGKQQSPPRKGARGPARAKGRRPMGRNGGR